VQTPKWLIVAKSEYLIRTSMMRRIRPYFPFLVTGLLALYVAFVAPAVVKLFIDDPLAFVLSKAALATVQTVLFVVFFYFIIIPINSTLKDVQTSQLEIFLKTPIRTGEVLLGEFLGKMPFYAIFVTLIAGFFTALMAAVGLDLLQMAMIVAIFFVTFSSALWIGTVISALLRTRLAKTAGGKDVGRALTLLIVLPMVVIMYAVMSGELLNVLADSSADSVFRTVLSLLPSSWGAEVILSLASNPGNMNAVGFSLVTHFGGLIAFFLAVLWLGVKAANKAYSLETGSLIASRAKPDGAFYEAIRFLGGSGRFSVVLVSVFKDFGRRLENLTKILFAVGLLAIVEIFLIKPEHPEDLLLLPQLMLPVLVGFVVGEVTLHGKEVLFIYKKTPSGVGGLVKARLLHGWLVVAPITAGIIATSAFLSDQTITTIVTITGSAVLFACAIVAFVLGLSLLNPAFSDKSSNYITNMTITIFAIPNGLLLLPSMVLDLPLLQVFWYVAIPFSWLLGAVTLYFGKIRLCSIE
jgi:hypothetical protein